MWGKKRKASVGITAFFMMAMMVQLVLVQAPRKVYAAGTEQGSTYIEREKVTEAGTEQASTYIEREKVTEAGTEQASTHIEQEKVTEAGDQQESEASEDASGAGQQSTSMERSSQEEEAALSILEETAPTSAQTGKTAVLPEEVLGRTRSKTVRVGYFNTLNFQEGGPNEHKYGAGYEYLQKLSNLTGWNYEYVYAPFKECMEMLENGEIDLLGNVNYTIDRSTRILFSSYPEGNDNYWIFTNEKHAGLADGHIESLNGCRIGVTEGSYQEMLLEQWLEAKDLEATIVPCADYDEMMQGLEQDTLDALVAPSLIMQRDSISVVSIGGGDYYFAVARGRRDLLSELNAALGEIHTTDPNYNDNLMARYEKKSSRSYALNRQETKWLLSHDNTIRVGYLENNLPFCGTQDGQLVGILATLLDTVESEYSIQIETTAYETREEIEEALEADEIDAGGPLVQDLDSLEQHQFASTDAIFEVSPVIAYDGQDYAKSMQKLAIARNSVYYKSVVEYMFPDAEVQEYDNIEDCLQAVLDGTAGSTIVPSARINILNANPLMKKLSTAEVANRQNLVLIAEKNDRRVATIFNKSIELASGLLNGAVLAQYSATKQPASFQEFMDAYAGPVMIALGVIIALLLALLHQLYIGQQKLRKALVEAKNANDANIAKTTFLNNMSHDIRTPMNAIVGFTNIALSAHPGAKVQNCLEKIQQSSEYLMSLINDVLDISRIESGKAKYNPVPCDIVEVNDAVLAVAHGFLQNRSLDFIVKAPTPEKRYVMADALRIREVLINILSNAIKFTADGGQITFTMDSRSNMDGRYLMVRYRISDTGVGMSEEFLKHLYEEFSQEGDGARTNYKGTGLGMTITKRYVDMMGGQIHVKSRKGVGTTFTVELPLELTEAPAKASASEGKTQRDLHGVRILMAEDNDLNAEIAITLLEEEGMTVTRAVDGQDVVNRFHEAPADSFDLILMDIMMPQKNGYEATKAIRTMSDRPDGQTIPIIAMTANAFTEDVEAALAAGMNGHLAKPIEMEEVVKTISKVLH